MKYDLKHLRQEAEYTWPFVRNNLSIKTLINIGAHNGEFADFLLGYFRPERGFLFEPQQSQQTALAAVCARHPGTKVFACALGEHSGTGRFFTNEHSPSSSLFQPGSEGKVNFPQLSEYHPEDVDVRRLDEVLAPADLLPDVLAVMDAQGAEQAIVRGGREIFSRLACLLVEMSFVPIYDKQPLFEEVHAELVACGLRLRGFKNQICSERNGGPLFAHCLYTRTL